jgi:benzoate membrane transport protein
MSQSKSPAASTRTGVERKHRGLPLIERPSAKPPRPRNLIRDIGTEYILNGIIGLIFSASGPIAVTLAVGTVGGLTQAQMASWVCAIFFSAGAATLVMSLAYRQPLGFAWTIPGTVMLGPSLQHLPFPEIVGAFFTTGVLILALGATGVVRKLMAAIPAPIIMAMVAAVFLRFGTDVVSSVQADPAVAGLMVLAFIALSMMTRLGKYVPPVLGALLVGVVAVTVTGKFHMEAGPLLAAPVFTAPQFTAAAQLELVVPLTLTVLVVQNGQGAAVLRAAGHHPPTNAFALASGAFSLVNAMLGGISACVTGPTNSLLTASGHRQRQYTAAVVYGILALLCAVFAPALTRLMLATPETFILTLGGVAMLRALQHAFVSAFSTTNTLGSLVTFIVTLSGLNFLNIHAAFWGIIIGYGVSRLLERPETRKS